MKKTEIRFRSSLIQELRDRSRDLYQMTTDGGGSRTEKLASTTSTSIPISSPTRAELLVSHGLVLISLQKPLSFP